MSATHSTNFHHKHHQHRAGTMFFKSSAPGVNAAADTAPTIEVVEPVAVTTAAAAAATASSAPAALATLVLKVSTKDSSSSAGATEAALIGLNDTNDDIIKSSSSNNNVNGDGGEDNADADTDNTTEGGAEKRSVAETSSRGSSVVSGNRWTRRKRAVRFCTVLKVYLIPRAKDYSERYDTARDTPVIHTFSLICRTFLVLLGAATRPTGGWSGQSAPLIADKPGVHLTFDTLAQSC
ncbi:unnamed protein product [Ectocarpus sp. CCAP 1310/34]|nr:unnamed protein product [Ectocarpus sp. CCAP 1310/34]